VGGCHSRSTRSNGLRERISGWGNSVRGVKGNGANYFERGGGGKGRVFGAGGRFGTAECGGAQRQGREEFPGRGRYSGLGLKSRLDTGRHCEH